MKSLFCYFLLLIILWASKGHGAQLQCEASSAGRNFIVGILGFFSSQAGLHIHFHFTTTGPAPAHIRVTAPSINMDKFYTVPNSTYLSMDHNLSQFEPGKQIRGIEVKSDVDISLSVILYGNIDVFEGFLALPVQALGTRYIAASYYPVGSHNSEILIVGVERNTDVILTPVLNGHMDSNITFRLQKFETYQFKSNNDVSGSIITSNKAVAVFSGSALAQVPVGIGDWQNMVEQMIPTKYWTKQFIIPPIYPREHFVLKIFADQDNTEVRYYNSTNNFTIYMNKGSMEELIFGTDPVVVKANKPVSVVQYGHDGDNMGGDPFMMNAQGLSQFLNSYKFLIQFYYSGGSNTIAITVLKNETDKLRLFGKPMSYWNAVNVSVAHPMEDYFTLFVNVSYAMYLELYHTGGVKFGAVLYGRPGTAVAYGYPLQLALSDQECEIHAGNHSTTDFHAVTTEATVHYNQTFKSDSGTWCFECDGMTHLQYCDKVVQCRNSDEVCYVQSYTRSFDVKLYRTGCVSQTACQNGIGNSDCMNCCNGSFCNSAGCGDNGFLSLGQRGPLCFDCSHKGENEPCNTVQLCDSNQACMIEKYKWGDNNFHYLMGCSQTAACVTKRSIHELTARHAPVCAHCCHSDFCNMNCTSTDPAPSLIG